MHRLKRALIWLRRCRHSRGFGVQSPWAYRFIRYVINEHYPYYAYEELRLKETGGKRRMQAENGDIRQERLTPETRKLCRLYFRLANFLQPKTVIDIAPATIAYSQYMHEGCHRSHVMVINTKDTPSALETLLRLATEPLLVRMTADTSCRHFFNTLRQHIGPQTIIAVEGIYDSKEARAFWREALADKLFTCNFDLYYCGVLTCAPRHYQANYVVNF